MSQADKFDKYRAVDLFPTKAKPKSYIASQKLATMQDELEERYGQLLRLLDGDKAIPKEIPFSDTKLFDYYQTKYKTINYEKITLAVNELEAYLKYIKRELRQFK